MGDSFGDRFEFNHRPQKKELHALMKEKHPVNITDDTQMALFSAEAMYSNDGGIEEVKKSYARWYISQTLRWKDTPSNMKTGLLGESLMYHRRAPGNTCLTSSRVLATGGTVKNSGNGCGTVMRELPILLVRSKSFSIEAARTTHQGEAIASSTSRHWEYVNLLLNGVIPNWFKGVPLSAVFKDGGWWADSCLDIAVWAFENCEGDFKRLLELSLLHSGDSDSIGAVAGGLFGVYYQEVPMNLYSRVHEKAVIEKVVDAFVQSIARSKEGCDNECQGELTCHSPMPSPAAKPLTC